MSTSQAELIQTDPCLYVARQPIFDDQRRLHAYELLFRDGVSSVFPDVAGDLATQAILLNTYVDIGLDRIAGAHRIFVNFTEETLLARLPLLFPKEHLIIEILENIEPSIKIIDACRELADAGYTFALDDFVYHQDFEPLIAQASIIKLDFLVSPRSEIESMAKRFLAQNKELLAEKIESREQYDYALSLGFKYFQGYFFSKPEILSTTSVQSAKVNLLQILAEVSRDDFDVHSIEDLLVRDISISYKLLRYINSTTMRTVNEITSLRHAVLLLGKREFRNFISLLLAADLAAKKPLELTRTTLIRARFCEGISELAGHQDTSQFFLLGLLSLLDAILDQPMEWVIQQLPLSQELSDALMFKGPLADNLNLTVAVERGHWEQLPDLFESLAIVEGEGMQAYIDAMLWADTMMETISAT